MKAWRRAMFFLVVALFLAEQARLLAPSVKRWAFPPEHDAGAAGRAVAARLGCFACHGPGGNGGIKNPGGRDGVVPALSGGEMMMWAESEKELREWILDGQVADEETDFERSGLSAGQGSERALVMPAFSAHVSAEDLDVLVAYLKANSGLHFPEDKQVGDGLELAHELGCFSCHGSMGVGGVANPGALKGYVPGFFGADYAELVVSKEEARQWIADGITERLANDPLASSVIAGQAIKMPAYGGFLEDAQIDALVALVEWLATGRWRNQEVP